MTLQVQCHQEWGGGIHGRFKALYEKPILFALQCACSTSMHKFKLQNKKRYRFNERILLILS